MKAAVFSRKQNKKIGVFLVRSNWSGEAKIRVWKIQCKKKGGGGAVVKEIGDKGRKIGLPQKGREKQENRPPRQGAWGTSGGARGQRGARQALTFPQHEEVRLLVRVEVSEGCQGAPGLGPKELGRDVVQRPRRDRPDSQQREPPKQQGQKHPRVRQPARRRHGSPSAPARRPTAALNGSRKAPCRRQREKERSSDARTTAAGSPLTLP